MASFGSVDNPFFEAFGPIVEVHWPKKDHEDCEGTGGSYGKWGTLEDNSFVNDLHPTGSTGHGGRGYDVLDVNGLFSGAWNNTLNCHETYTIDVTVTVAGTTDTENYSYSGLLLPGQSFIVAMIRQGWLDYYTSGPFAPPSLDEHFLYGYGDYRLIEITTSTHVFDP